MVRRLRPECASVPIQSRAQRSGTHRRLSPRDISPEREEPGDSTHSLFGSAELVRVSECTLKQTPDALQSQACRCRFGRCAFHLSRSGGLVPPNRGYVRLSATRPARAPTWFSLSQDPGGALCRESRSHVRTKTSRPRPRSGFSPVVKATGLVIGVAVFVAVMVSNGGNSAARTVHQSQTYGDRLNAIEASAVAGTPAPR